MSDAGALPDLLGQIFEAALDEALWPEAWRGLGDAFDSAGRGRAP